MKTKNTVLLFAIAIFSGVAGFVGGFSSSVSIAVHHPEIFMGAPKGDLGQVTTVAEFISKNALPDVSTRQMEVGAIKGMMASVDEHSEFFVDDEVGEFENSSTGKYSGIGVGIEKKEEGFYIKKVYKNSPAAKSGIVVGDRIISVNGKSVSDMDTFELSSNVRGTEGTEVIIGIYRKSNSKVENVTVNRQKIEYEIAIVSGENPYPTFRLEEFSSGASFKLAQAFSKNINQDTKGIILDLSGNPGGSLKEAVNIASMFLPDDSTVVKIKGRNSSYDEEHKSKLNPLLSDVIGPEISEILKKIPMTVIVDKWSASASEVVSGALSDFDRAKLVGTKTYGKGTVQQVFKITDKNYIKMTIAKYVTPKGREVNKVGLTPDIEAANMEEATKKSLQYLRESKQETKKSSRLLT